MDDARLFRRVVCMPFPMIMLVALYRNVLGRDSTVDCSFDVILTPWIMASMFSKRMVNWSNPRQAVLKQAITITLGNVARNTAAGVCGDWLVNWSFGLVIGHVPLTACTVSLGFAFIAGIINGKVNDDTNGFRRPKQISKWQPFVLGLINVSDVTILSISGGGLVASSCGGAIGYATVIKTVATTNARFAITEVIKEIVIRYSSQLNAEKVCEE
ncbi:AAC_collapsed_G0027250.mRNA.1.CDS.1 [Saccharomyces cerevisiae]|nr:AAC_collapsed_G0027250.mRNA.1.CDS.1 [Saccharomyces cerevisiae]